MSTTALDLNAYYITCAHCGSTKAVRWWSQRFCSPACGYAGRRRPAPGSRKGVGLGMPKTGRRRVPVAELHPSTLDIAWAAGVYEGEGTAGISTSIVSVMQKDLWLCRRLQQLFGGSIRTLEPRRACPNPIHHWQICGGRARGFLWTVYRFLSPRRQAQARRMLGCDQ